MAVERQEMQQMPCQATRGHSCRQQALYTIKGEAMKLLRT
jgi:hypothetical protein